MTRISVLNLQGLKGFIIGGFSFIIDGWQNAYLIKGRRSLLISLFIVLSPSFYAFSAYGAVTGNYNPATAYDEVNNRYLMVFIRHDDSHSYICGQLVNYEGASFGNEFVISIARGYREDLNPSVAYDSANKRFLVVWTDLGDALSSDTDICGQLVDANGKLHGRKFIISGMNGNQQPLAAYDSVNEKFLVSWEVLQDSSGDFEIYAQFVTPDGMLDGENFLMSAEGERSEYNSVDENQYVTAKKEAMPIQINSQWGATYNARVRISGIGSGSNVTRGTFTLHDDGTFDLYENGREDRNYTGTYVFIPRKRKYIVRFTLDQNSVGTLKTMLTDWVGEYAAEAGININGPNFQFKPPRILKMTIPRKTNRPNNLTFIIRGRVSAFFNGKNITKAFSYRCVIAFQYLSPLSVPTDLNATAVSSSQIDLSWTAATGNVLGYKVYRDGTYLKSANNISTSDTELAASTQYCYQVSAYGASNGESALSAKSCATTQGGSIPPLQYILAVQKSGSGSGIVTGPGINCGSSCSEELASGTQVTLIATPNNGSTFIGWSEACTGTGTCTVIMSRNQTVTATFTAGTICDATAQGFTDNFSCPSSRWDWSYYRDTGYHTCPITIDGKVVVANGITSASQNGVYSDCDLHEDSNLFSAPNIVEASFKYNVSDPTGSFGFGLWDGNMSSVNAIWFAGCGGNCDLAGWSAQVWLNGTPVYTQAVMNDITNWHTYRIERYADHATFYIDGVQVATYRGTQSSADMHISSWIDNRTLESGSYVCHATGRNEIMYIDYITESNP